MRDRGCAELRMAVHHRWYAIVANCSIFCQHMLHDSSPYCNRIVTFADKTLVLYPYEYATIYYSGNNETRFSSTTVPIRVLLSLL